MDEEDDRNRDLIMLLPLFVALLGAGIAVIIFTKLPYKEL